MAKKPQQKTPLPEEKDSKTLPNPPQPIDLAMPGKSQPTPQKPEKSPKNSLWVPILVALLAFVAILGIIFYFQLSGTKNLAGLIKTINKPNPLQQEKKIEWLEFIGPQHLYTFKYPSTLNAFMHEELLLPSRVILFSNLNNAEACRKFYVKYGSTLYLGNSETNPCFKNSYVLFAEKISQQAYQTAIEQINAISREENGWIIAETEAEGFNRLTAYTTKNGPGYVQIEYWLGNGEYPKNLKESTKQMEEILATFKFSDIKQEPIYTHTYTNTLAGYTFDHPTSTTPLTTVPGIGVVSQDPQADTIELAGITITALTTPLPKWDYLDWQKDDVELANQPAQKYTKSENGNKTVFYFLKHPHNNYNIQISASGASLPLFNQLVTTLKLFDTNPDSWSTYQDPEYGFSFKYPGYSDIYTNDNYILISDQKTIEIINLGRGDGPYTPGYLRVQISDTPHALNPHDRELESQEVIDLNGYQLTKDTYRITNPGPNFNIYQNDIVATLEKDGKYLIFSTPNGQTPRLFDQILSTLQLTNN